MYRLRKRNAARERREFPAGTPVQDPKLQLSTHLRLLTGIFHRVDLYLPVFHDQLLHIIHGIRHIKIVIQGHLGRDVPPATIHVDMLLQKFHHKNATIPFQFMLQEIV